jgi:hypothetical protein
MNIYTLVLFMVICAIAGYIFVSWVLSRRK